LPAQLVAGLLRCPARRRFNRLYTQAVSSVKRQVLLLALGQALLYVNNVTLIAINGLVGMKLAQFNGWPLALATLPVTAYVVGGAVMTVPASFFMQRFGRRTGFTVGAVFCILGMLLAAYAVNMGSMVLLCAAVFLAGFYNAFGQYFRFAAADAAAQYAPSFKEKAISLVLAGGIAGGIIGPTMSKISREWVATPFVGTYMALAGFAVVSLLIVQALRLATPTAQEIAGPQRSLREIAAQPAFITAVACAMISFGVMNLLMTATPLAMKVCGFGYDQSADVIMWHVVAMFAPGFFTGSLNQRFGTRRVMFAGAMLIVACAIINLQGVSYWHFWVALFVLGLGWNFMYTGATTLLTTTYTAAEKAKIQGINDLAVFLTMITSSFSSGVLVNTQGWANLNVLSIPVVLVAAALLVWAASRMRGTSATQAA
jgi:MFS family permease